MGLSGLLQGLTQVGDFVDQRQQQDHLSKIMSINPQFGAQLYSTQFALEEQQRAKRLEQQQKRQQDALRAIAPRFRSGMSLQDGLSEYASITGDVSPLLDLARAQTADTANIREFNLTQQNPEFAKYMEAKGERNLSGTEALVERVMAENPNLSYMQALAYVQKLSREGMILRGGGGQQGGLSDLMPSAQPAPVNTGNMTALEDQGMNMPVPNTGMQDEITFDDAVTPTEQPMTTPQAGGSALPVVESMAGYDELLAKRAGGVAKAEKQAAADVELETAPKIAEETEKSKVTGKDLGEKLVELKGRVSRMPQLNNVVKRLARLGDIATFTNVGQLRDAAKRELGLDVGDAGAARKAYTSMVDNEVLPLLRETFGAQFTQKEGESLKITLGDPNASPREKRAVLRSFLTTKMETINTNALAAGQEPIYSDQDIQAAADAIATEVGGMPENTPQTDGGWSGDKEKRYQELLKKRGG